MSRNHASNPRAPRQLRHQSPLRRVDRLRDRGRHHAVVHRRERVALAEDHRRDALRDHADDAAVAGEQLHVRLRLDVDDARRDDESARVDALLRRAPSASAPGGAMRAMRSPTMPTSP